MSPITGIPVVASVYTGALALSHWTGILPTPLVVTIYTVIALAAIAGAVLAVPRSQALREITHKHTAILVWIIVGILAYTAWMITALIMVDQWFYLLLILAGATPIVSLAAMGVINSLSQPVAPQSPIRLSRALPDLTATRKIASVLAIAGYEHLDVLRVEVIDGGRGYQARLQETLKALDGRSRAFTAKTAVTQLGIAYREVTGLAVHSSWITLTEAPTVGEWDLVIHSRDVLGDVQPYIDSPEALSIRDSFPVGCYDTGGVQQHCLAHHGQIIGSTGAGKSAFTHLAIANATRMTDAVQWVGGLEKLYDLVAPWILPYKNSTYPLPLDWIATGKNDTKEMLRAALRVARARQDTPYDQREDWPWIIIWIDEAWSVLEDMEASQLMSQLRRIGLSAHIVTQLMSQRGVNNDFGADGGGIKANAGWAAVFNTADQQEVGRTLGNWAVQPTLAPGQCVLKPPETSPDSASGLRPIRVYYIQDPDPAKKRLHDGARIDEVSWARRGRVAVLDARSAQWAGGAYRERHTHWTPALEDYLTSRASTTLTLEDGSDSIDAMIDATIQQALDTATPRPQLSSAPTGLLVGVARRERIAQILKTHGPLSPADIAGFLREEGDEVASMVALGNLLRDMTTSGTLVRPARGVYALTA
jgi:hypothetical protein